MELEKDFEINDQFEDIKKENPFGVMKPSDTVRRQRMLATILVVIFCIILLIIIIVVFKNKILVSKLGWDSNRLPEYQIPYSYQLTLELDVAKLVIRGEIEIDLILKNITNLIVLHGADIKIQTAQMTILDSLESPVTNKFFDADQIGFDNQNQYILFRFDALQNTNLNEKNETYIQLRIFFQSKIRKDFRGVFITYYNDQNNIQRPIIGTQFEPMNARLAFPCD